MGAQCDECPAVFAREDGVSRHKKEVHGAINVSGSQGAEEVKTRTEVIGMFNDALWITVILITRSAVGRLEIDAQSLDKSIPLCGTVLTPSHHSP